MTVKPGRIRPDHLKKLCAKRCFRSMRGGAGRQRRQTHMPSPGPAALGIVHHGGDSGMTKGPGGA